MSSSRNVAGGAAGTAAASRGDGSVEGAPDASNARCSGAAQLNSSAARGHREVGRAGQYDRATARQRSLWLRRAQLVAGAVDLVRRGAQASQQVLGHREGHLGLGRDDDVGARGA
jgi:hypothetical protein